MRVRYNNPFKGFDTPTVAAVSYIMYIILVLFCDAFRAIDDLASQL